MIENNHVHSSKNVVLKIVAVFVLLAVMAGIACLSFKLGERHALTESNVALGLRGEQGQQGDYDEYVMPMHREGYIQGYGMPGYGMHSFGFGSGIVMFFGGLFVIFLVFGAIRMLFWGPRWHHHFPYPPQGYYNAPAASEQKPVAAKPAVKKGKK
jgi:hypothetical protein